LVKNLIFRAARAHPRSPALRNGAARAHPRSPALTRALQNLRFSQKVQFETAFWHSLSKLMVLNAFARLSSDFHVEASIFYNSFVKKCRMQLNVQTFAEMFVFAKVSLRIREDSPFRDFLFGKQQFAGKQPYPWRIHQFTRVVL
jgi:hypothetical protein